MAILVDWVQQAVSGTPGTGVITLSSAVTGYIRLQDSSDIVDGSLVYYNIADGSNYERGIGTYNTLGTALTRTFIQAKYEFGTYTENPGTGLSLTSAAIVSCTPVADTHNFRGALVTHSAQQAVANNTTTICSFNTEAYDTDGFHDTVTNNSRFTIPSNKGIRKVRLHANVEFAPHNTGIRYCYIMGNGTYAYASRLGSSPALTGWIARLQVSTGVIDCTDGDYFDVRAHHTALTTINVNHYSTYYEYHWFAIEVVE